MTRTQINWPEIVRRSLKRHEKPEDEDLLYSSIDRVLSSIRKNDSLVEMACRASLLLELNSIRERFTDALSVCDSEAEKALCIALIVIGRKYIANSSSKVGDRVYELCAGNDERLLIDHAPIIKGRRVGFQLTLQISEDQDRLIQRRAIVDCSPDFESKAHVDLQNEFWEKAGIRYFYFPNPDIAKDPLMCASTVIRSLEHES